MDVLRDWQEAPAFVLSCPGPMRRHGAALIPFSKLALPQVLLGGESQCLAFAASQPDLAARMFFAPAPEMFSGPLSLHAAWRAIGKTPHSAADIVHLRFGSVRDSRVLKAARNAAVIAETATAPPITMSHHPFASGRVVPAAMQRVFTYGKQSLRPAPVGGTPLAATDLPKTCVTADLEAAATQKPARGRASGGLDLVRLADYAPDSWASGEIGRPGAMPDHISRHIVLLPWNMAHFGSIVPELLTRLALFRRADALPHAVVLLPFNDPGPTGMIGALRKAIRDAAEAPDLLLQTIFVARVTHLRGVSKLKSLSRTVWVDGNDPEAWWTLARCMAAGFECIKLPADEPIRIEADTPFGTLHFDVGITAQRGLRHMLRPPRHSKGTGRPA